MKRALFALVLALALAGCGAEPVTAPGTVVSVQEAKQAVPEDLMRFDDDHLSLPEVAWQVEVQLDDGSAVSVTYSGERRYEPGERVHLLLSPDGALLL